MVRRQGLLTWSESEQNIFPHSCFTTETVPAERKQWKSTPCGPQLVCLARSYALLSSPAHPMLEARHWWREDLSSVSRTGSFFPIFVSWLCNSRERRCHWTPQRTGKTHLSHSKNTYQTLGTLSQLRKSKVNNMTRNQPKEKWRGPGVPLARHSYFHSETDLKWLMVLIKIEQYLGSLGANFL